MLRKTLLLGCLLVSQVVLARQDFSEVDDPDLMRRINELVLQTRKYLSDVAEDSEKITKKQSPTFYDSQIKHYNPKDSDKRQNPALSSSRRFSTSSPSILSWMSSTFIPSVGVCAHRAIQCNARSRFRSIDGSCNNLDNPEWGQAFLQLRRFLQPRYFDGVSSPRVTGVDGSKLPSARLVSRTVHTPDNRVPKLNGITHMLMQWGQFIDHDLILVPVRTGVDGVALTCCDEDTPPAQRGRRMNGCFPIDIPPGDRHFNVSCLTFARSIHVNNERCTEIPVEQLNLLTTYLDASTVYGSDDETADDLRSFRNGLLKSENDLLPPNRETNEPCSSHCFKAGDERVNEQMGLTSMHTVFLREHNRIARTLKIINPHWHDERLYQESRKIIGAFIQKITYRDFLPLVLSKRVLRKHGLLPSSRDVYDNKVDASIRNSFSTAAYRFGHTLIRSTFSRLPPDFTTRKQIKLSNMFEDTNMITSSDGGAITDLIGGLLFDAIGRPDRFFSNQVTDFLFNKKNVSLDLVSFSIQRGRDHGLPGYTAFREWCGLSRVRHFRTGPAGLIDHDLFTVRQLQKVYRSHRDIDLFSGGISEKPLPGSLVGPTFSCIIAKQFSLLKRGDRFWYERKDPVTGFQRDQLDEIELTTLSRILCDNTRIFLLQPDAFRSPSKRNSLQTCSRIHRLNLNKWRERRRN